MLNDDIDLEQEVKALELENKYLESWVEVLKDKVETKERILKKVEGKIILQPMEWERLKSYEHKNIKAVTLIYDFCETCSSHDECPEDECMLFQVEQCLMGSDKDD